MTLRRYFGTDGVRGRVGEPPITPEFDAEARLRGGQGARRATTPSRMGIAPRCSSARTRASPATCSSRRWRRACPPRASTSISPGPMPTPGGRVSHARAAPVRRYRDQRFAQSVRRQRHQVLLRGRRQAARRRGARDRAPHGRAARVRALGEARQGAPHRGRRRTLHRVLQEHVSQRARPARHAASSSTARTARPTTSRPACSTSSARTSIAVGTSPTASTSTTGVGATHPRFARRAGEARMARTSASRSTATATGCSMADSEGRVYDGDQLLYVIAMDYKRRDVHAGGVVGHADDATSASSRRSARPGSRWSARVSAIATCSRCCASGAGRSAARTRAT